MLKAKKLIIILILIVSKSILDLNAQNLFVSNLYNNLVFETPSIAGINDYSILQFNYRNQWPIDGIYNTYSASYFHSLDHLNSNVGIILNHDRQYKGFLTNSSVGVNYVYKLHTGYRRFLYMGISGHYFLQRLNTGALTFENNTVGFQENRINTYPYINTGLTYSLYNIHFFSFSVSNVVPLTNHPLAGRVFSLSYLAHIKSHSHYGLPSYFEPIIAVNKAEDYLEFKYGGNLGFYNVKGGLLISQTGIKLNTTSFLLGIMFENIEFIYTYDLNLSGAVSINPKMAAHEVTFLSKFQYKRRRTRRGAIKCPKI